MPTRIFRLLILTVAIAVQSRTSNAQTAAATTTTLSVAAGTTVGQPIVATVTVKAPASNGPPVGLVELDNDGAFTGLLQPLSPTHSGDPAYAESAATFTFGAGDALYAGVYMLGANFIGGSEFANSSGGGQSLTVGLPTYNYLPDGVGIATVVAGSGPAIQAGQTATVYYTGFYSGGASDGGEFDESFAHSPGTFDYTVEANPKQVIVGFDEGTQGMKVGETRVVFIPSAEGYMDNMNRVFVIQLLSIDGAPFVNTAPPFVGFSAPDDYPKPEQTSKATFTAAGYTYPGGASVADVQVSSDGVSWLAAKLANDGTWSAQVALVPGTNTIYAYATDTSGNVGVNLATVVYTGTGPKTTVSFPKGTYAGLFAPGGGVRRQGNSGSFNFTLTATGAVSGALQMGSVAVHLSGAFATGGSATLVSKRQGQTAVTTTLRLATNGGNVSVSGTVTDGSFVAQLSGFQEVFNSANKAVGYAGKYTLLIPGTNDPDAGPFGTGFGTVTVGPTGIITFAGSLADGTAVNQSSVVSSGGLWPFYLPLYGGTGSLWAWNQFSNGAIMCPGGASWINVSNSVKTAANRSGFTNQAATVIGSPYTPTSTPLLNLTSGAVVLAGGGLPFVITDHIALSSNGKITVASGSTNKLALTINKTTGRITGSFADPSNLKKTIKVNGVIVQSQANAQGFFLGDGQSGTLTLESQ